MLAEQLGQENAALMARHANLEQALAWVTHTAMCHNDNIPSASLR